MKVRMAVLLVDALGWELACATEGFGASLPERRRLSTILGFSSGALPTIFTGRMPSEHGRFLMYRRARGDTPFAGFGLLRFLPPRLRRSWKLSRALTRLVARRGVRGYFNLYDVPRALLAEFDLAEREDIFAPRGLPGGAWWDALESAGVPWRGWNWRTPEAEMLDAMTATLARDEADVVFGYTAELDALLHREGSKGAGVRAKLAGYDAWFTRARREAEARGEALWLYLLSDHGMVDVERTVDVMGRLAALPVRCPAHYLAFFDSTFARFWWRKDGARETVRAALEGLPGRWLDDEALEREGARFPDRDYGDDLFLLDPGVLMVPSFMGGETVAAMHGYDASHPAMAALLWSNRPVPPDVRHLRDVRGFLEGEVAALARAAA